MTGSIACYLKKRGNDTNRPKTNADSAVQFCCSDVSGDSPLLVKPRFHMTLSEMSFDTSDTERFDLIRFDENECSKI